MLSLKELINKLDMSDSYDLKDGAIDYVKVNRRTSDVNILIKSSEDLEIEFKSTLENKLKEKLNEYNVNLKFFTQIKDYENEEELVREEIIKYNKSAKVWIKDILINVDKNNNKIIISIPQIEIYNLIKTNGLKNYLEDKLKVFNNYLVEFLCPSEGYTCDVDRFIEVIDDEEKNFTKNIEVSNVHVEKTIVKKISDYKYGRKKIDEIIELKDLSTNFQNVTVKAKIFNIEYKELKNGKILGIFSITDYTSSTLAKIFLTKDKYEEFKINLQEGDFLLLSGSVNYDTFSRCVNIMIRYLEKIEEEVKMDTSDEKRVELRLHTKMSQLNGVTSFSDFAKRAKLWGHDAIAITDISDVQGFPEAMDASKSTGLKILYGLDANFVDDMELIVRNYNSDFTYNKFVVFDIETTGLSSIHDKITEIGAVKIEDGIITERFSKLINPEIPIPEVVQELTGITNELVKDEKTIDEIIVEFYDFCKDAVLVAHNAKFDISFIKREMLKKSLSFNHPIFDTLVFARCANLDLKRFNLSTICKKLGISLVGAHRAVNDAEATAEMFLKLMKKVGKEGYKTFDEINSLIKNIDSSRLFESQITIFAKNIEGLKNLYKLVSKSHMKYFNVAAKVPKSLIKEYRQGLLIGSGTSSAPLFDAIYRNEDEKEIEEIAKFYDYFEIQPVENNIAMILDGKLTAEDIKSINKKIYNLGKKLNIPVVATGDVFYLDDRDDIVRRIIINGKPGRPSREAKLEQKLFFRTTDEMLREFSYLGEEEKREVVITNTRLISDMIESIEPIPKGTYPPVIEGSEEDLRNMTYEKAKSIYGDPLPELVEKRLKRELDSIISNGYAVLYIIAQKLVKKSNDDGYLVGSRGSVGSSFVATMAGITEVNPLPPHYICKNCKHSEFYDDPTIGSGVDLPDKICPVCGENLIKEGHNIPFEVFLGFNGDKEPDIDLNFAGEYQPNAHKYTEELFGKGFVFRAGTIGTVAEKTAYGYVKKYFENNPNISPIEIERLTKKAMGVKRTSGQHPGGVMICPKSKDIFDFTPIQYPADDKNSGVITTHFDYNFIHGKILKLDILGHDGPTIIKMLEDFTGVDSSKINLHDEETLKLFSTSDNLNMDENIMSTETGTLGIPEFGTRFVRQMLIETKPSSFAELVRISGLSHGTDVWTSNAQELVKNGMATLKDVISTREDIMLYLINAGAENKMAFDTMEKVRKGKGLTEEQENIMKNLDLPPWYIDSCKKIKYMFPKAHAVAYVMLSFRIAYFKLNYPEAFYATYFTTKLQDFAGEIILKGKDAVKSRLDYLQNTENITAKEKSQITVFEVALEMFARGYEFLPLDIYKSEANKFIIEDGKVRMPLRAIGGIGEQVANKIVEERSKGDFLSIEDLKNRTKAGNSVIGIFNEYNLIDNLDNTNQISFFNLM